MPDLLVASAADCLYWIKTLGAVSCITGFMAMIAAIATLVSALLASEKDCSPKWVGACALALVLSMGTAIALPSTETLLLRAGVEPKAIVESKVERARLASRDEGLSTQQILLLLQGRTGQAEKE